jgi:hypothetical protein
MEHAILTILYLAGAKTTASWCAKKGDLQRAFALDVLMVTSPKLPFVANGNNSTGVGLTPGETIHFGSLEFIADLLGYPSLSPEEGDSGAIFIGMVHNGSPSLRTTLEEYSNEGGATLGTGGGSGSSGPQGCNVVTLIVHITATPVSENTPAIRIILRVMVRIAAPQLGMELLPD